MVAKKKRQNDPLYSSSDSAEEKQQGSCSHVTKAVDMIKHWKVFKMENENCSECTKTTNGGTENGDDDKNDFAYDKTLWLCLNCGTHLCGRGNNRHVILHFETPHSDSFEVHCYECENEIYANNNKKLKECTEFIKKELNKTKVKLENLPHTMLNTIRPLLEAVPGSSVTNYQVNQVAVKPSAATNEDLPRVRGLSNLGNTCFFNAVMQCLAQTPYLLTVLNGAVSGE